MPKVLSLKVQKHIVKTGDAEGVLLRSKEKPPKAQTENLSEEVDIDATGHAPDYMNNYLRTLGAVSKK